MAVPVSWITLATPLPSGPVRVGITAEGVASVSFEAVPGGGPVGMEVKRWLLTLEGVLPPTLDWTGPA
jgi:hypothetical protein